MHSLGGCSTPFKHDNCATMNSGALFTLSLPPAFLEIEPSQIQPAVALHLEAAEVALARIEDGSGESADAVLDAIEDATEPLELAMGLVEHLESVANTPELRAAYNAVLPSVSGFWARIPLRAKLYAVLERLNESSEKQFLSPTKRRLLEKSLDDFRRHGAQLDNDAKRRLLEIDESLSQLTAKFSQNVLDSTNAFEILLEDDSRLSGLPQSAIEASSHSAASREKTGYRLTLQAPAVTAVLTYADDAALRKQLWHAYNTRCVDEPYDNSKLLSDILALRGEKAKLLGFQSFAALALQPRMAETVEAARTFVRELTDRTLEPFQTENQVLLKFRRELEGESAPELQPWDIAYYAEKLRRNRFDFDEEQLRDYFPFEQTLQGLFNLCSRLFGVQIRPAAGLQVWDEAVQAFKILDGSRTLGTFYVDPYPRDNKGGGAWMHGLVAATAKQAGLAVVVCNATPPTDRHPSLLTHREVETLFHEFGHLLHHLLSQVEVRSLAGTRVAQDFVELPSQIMENWCWEREALDVFAAHYQTGELIPADLFERLKSVRTYRAAAAQMRQLGFAALDLALHVDFDPTGKTSVLDFASSVLKSYAAARLPEDYALVASFTHLFAHPVGYAAGYYSYKWAEVLDADAFSRFTAEGIFNPSTGDEWRRKVLERGDALEPMAIFEDFMGRRPSQAALMARQGLGP